jgi:hypothetical protein
VPLERYTEDLDCAGIVVLRSEHLSELLPKRRRVPGLVGTGVKTASGPLDGFVGPTARRSASAISW